MYLNGTVVSPDKAVWDNYITVGVRSIIPEEDYNAQLLKKWFGRLTPLDFQGYNAESFPFWSSEPFTHASVILALSQYRALVATGQLPPFVPS